MKNCSNYTYTNVLSNDVLETVLIPMVTRIYKKNGYLTENDEKFSGSAHLLSPYAGAYASGCDRGGVEDVFGMVGICRDSEIGLPADAYYKEDIDAYRKKGCHVAEATQLVVDHDLLFERTGRKVDMSVTLAFFKFVLMYLLEKNIDVLFVINVLSQTHHVNLYRNIGFTQVGQGKNYESANNISVMLIALDVRKAKHDKRVKNLFSLKVHEGAPGFGTRALHMNV